MTSLQAGGIAVGLPWGEAGNSEVGHLTMGYWKNCLSILSAYQFKYSKWRIFKNKALNNAYNFALKNNSTLHCLGLLSESHAHSAYDHIIALLQMAVKKQLSKICFHFFTDGRDSRPQSGKSLVEHFLTDKKQFNIGTIGSLSGRYYALDRSKNWSLTERVYRLLTEGEGKTAKDPWRFLITTIIKKLRRSFILSQL